MTSLWCNISIMPDDYVPARALRALRVNQTGTPKPPQANAGLRRGSKNADGTRPAQGCLNRTGLAYENHCERLGRFRLSHQLGPAVRSADGAGSRPCRRAPGYIPKSETLVGLSSHPVVGHPSMGAPTVLAGLEAKAFHPAPVTVAAYNQYGSYCQCKTPLPFRGGAARLGGLPPSRSGVGLVRLALRCLDSPHPLPLP
jgi:hypothetical protein